MSKVLDITTYRKPQGVTHYAYLGDLYGTAELLNGSGYLFRAEGQRKATLVSSKAPALLLLGLVQEADAQYADDLVRGGFAGVACGRHEGRQ
jgi:hypothetical protein